ncbi:MAG TPA: hypothetical protein VK525_00175 [Candidatus Saccharimonadales bacterium]|jgi:hypothetical protein|nr:hypothetical protein [Candidatus Saccharimonadales bacterium]
MANFFKKALIGFLSDPIEEGSGTGSGPQKRLESTELQHHRGVEEVEIRAKETAFLGEKTEVLAQTNFRTIVEVCDILNTDNGSDVAAGPSGR